MKKNKTFLDSIKCAIVGLREAFKTEKNFKIYIVIASVGLMLNIYYKIELAWWIGYITTVCGVFAAELLNTAIERVADALTTEVNKLIKEAKDIAAGAVLFWGFGYFTVEIIAIGSKILC